MSESQLAWHRAITRNNDWMDSGMVCRSSLWQAPRAASMTHSKLLKSLAGS